MALMAIINYLLLLSPKLSLEKFLEICKFYAAYYDIYSRAGQGIVVEEVNAICKKNMFLVEGVAR